MFYKITDQKKIEEVLLSNKLGRPKSIRFKGNAIDAGDAWDFDLIIISECENGEYEESFYIATQETTKEKAIENIKGFIVDFQKTQGLFKSELIDMRTKPTAKE